MEQNPSDDSSFPIRLEISRILKKTQIFLTYLLQSKSSPFLEPDKSFARHYTHSLPLFSGDISIYFFSSWSSVKMRTGWNDENLNAPRLAKIAVHQGERM